jgi:hypothetical protein
MNRNDYDMLTQEAKQIVERMARHFMNTRFDCIPNVLFEQHKEYENGELDSILMLINGEHCCPECGNTNIEFYTDNGNKVVEVTDAYDYDFVQCASCEAQFDSEDELDTKGANYAWPGAHAYSWWTTEYNDNQIFVDAAASAGFLVYQPQDFDGYVLSIDGGGYSFMDQHWVPLYLSLGYEWHKQESDWPYPSEEMLLSRKLKIWTGPCEVKYWVDVLKGVFGEKSAYAGTEHAYLCYLTKEQAEQAVVEHATKLSPTLRRMITQAQIIPNSKS